MMHDSSINDTDDLGGLTQRDTVDIGLFDSLQSKHGPDAQFFASVDASEGMTEDKDKLGKNVMKKKNLKRRKRQKSSN